MAYSNLSNDNDTMRVKLDLEDYCSQLENQNSSKCVSSGRTISFPTPIIMLSVGILGNVMALVVLYTSRRHVRQTVVFTLLEGLAWTDLMGQLCTGPVVIVTYANRMTWQGGEALCIYHGFVMVLFGIVHPLLVGMMTLERFVALKFSYFYVKHITRRMAQFSIVGCWMLTGLFCVCPILGFGSYEIQFPNTWCFLNYHRESIDDVIYAFFFSIFNIAVLVFIFVTNCFVIYTLLSMRRVRIRNSICSVASRTRYRYTSFKLEMETEMIWFLGAITIVFCALWLPLNINILVIQITGQADVRSDLLAVRLASINQILDPWFYILLRKALFFKIRKHFLKSFSGQGPVRFISHSELTRYATSATSLYTHSAGHQQNSSTTEDKYQLSTNDNIFASQSVECSSKLDETSTEKAKPLPSHKYLVCMKKSCIVICEKHKKEKQVSDIDEVEEVSESMDKKEASTSVLELNKVSENVNVAKKTSQTRLFLEPEKQRQLSPASFNEVFASGSLVKRTSTESNYSLKTENCKDCTAFQQTQKVETIS